MCIYETNDRIYTLYKLTTINNMTIRTSIHTLHIDICPWTNMPATLHIFVSMQFYCSHMDPRLLNIDVQRNKLELLITMLLPYMCQQQMCPQMPYICHMWKLFHMQRGNNFVSISLLYLESLQSTTWPQVLVYTYFILLTYSPWTNMSATLHMDVPLYCYCSLHIDPTLLHKQIKNQQNATLTYHAIAIHGPRRNMPLKCHMYVTNAN